MKEDRNRASGWKHAKLSGHKNENMVKELLDKDSNYANNFLCRIGNKGRTIIETSIGGIHEKNVSSVINGKKTKSKTDLKIFLNNKKIVNVSIKKSLCGQVYFVRAGLFIETFEKQFCQKIPETVKRAINLFWAEAEDATEIIKEFANKSDKKNYNLQLRHKSLNATTLKEYNKELYDSLLAWFRDNTCKIAKLCFAMGAVLDENEWSEYIWYINLLGENDIDNIFSIDDICTKISNVSKEGTYYSSKNGGTTIQLPFGFVQWHQKKLQFHHNYYKLIEILKQK